MNAGQRLGSTPMPLARLAAPLRGTLIVLNGPSSAGKTSIARALQAALPAPHLHVQLDAFRAMEPAGYFSAAQLEHAARRTAALCRAINAAAREYLAHGLNVLLDHVLTADAWALFQEDFKHERVLLVGVRCSVDVLVRREQARGDRPSGLAMSQQALHEGRTYDFNIDTSDASTADCAARLCAWLRGGPAPGAFLAQRGSTNLATCREAGPRLLNTD